MRGICPFITAYGDGGVGLPTMFPETSWSSCLGYGCSVLRPKGLWGNMLKRYLYVGEIYCDGVMDGELVG